MGLFLRFPSHPHPSRLGTVAKEVAISADTLGSKLTQMTAPAGNRNGTGCCSGRARSSTQAVVCLNSSVLNMPGTDLKIGAAWVGCCATNRVRTYPDCRAIGGRPDYCR